MDRTEDKAKVRAEDRARDKAKAQAKDRAEDKAKARAEDRARDKAKAQAGDRAEKVTPVGFEPTQLALVELESTPLDHSGKVS